jgi:hypothetical protein
MPEHLTAKQRKLKKELEEIAENVGVDFWNIHDKEK